MGGPASQRLSGTGDSSGALGRKLYGLEVLRRLECDSDLIVSEGTVYPLLSRLKALGLVRVSGWSRRAGIRANTMR